jgi:hypothetical protein
LVLVHRQQLLDQWVARLRAFLDVDAARVGVIRGGRKRPTGFIDVATIQSLVRKGEVSDLVANYGHLVVDECHHLSAVSFEGVARAAKPKYVLGLSATVTRKDGHHPIIFMQCGPIRYRVDARRQAAARPFSHQVVIKRTAFHAERWKAEMPVSIQELYRLLACDTARNDMIFNDVLSALEAGRSPVVITERKNHLQAIAERLTKFAKNVIVLKGGMGAKQRNQVNEALKSVPENEERVIVATGRYLGEGFDDARLTDRPPVARSTSSIRQKRLCSSPGQDFCGEADSRASGGGAIPRRKDLKSKYGCGRWSRLFAKPNPDELPFDIPYGRSLSISALSAASIVRYDASTAITRDPASAIQPVWPTRSISAHCFESSRAPTIELVPLIICAARRMLGTSARAAASRSAERTDGV